VFQTEIRVVADASDLSPQAIETIVRGIPFAEVLVFSELEDKHTVYNTGVYNAYPQQSEVSMDDSELTIPSLMPIG